MRTAYLQCCQKCKKIAPYSDRASGIAVGVNQCRCLGANELGSMTIGLFQEFVVGIWGFWNVKYKLLLPETPWEGEGWDGIVCVIHIYIYIQSIYMCKARNESRVEDLNEHCASFLQPLGWEHLETSPPHHVELAASELSCLVHKRHFCGRDGLFRLCRRALCVAVGMKSQTQNSTLCFLTKVGDPAVRGWRCGRWAWREVVRY